jgi:hypothetical protein
VVVRPRDASSQPTDAEVALSSQAGELSEVRRSERGVYRAWLTMPSTLRGTGLIQVEARSGEVRGGAALPFAPGEPASVVVGGPDSLPGDASVTRLLSIDVADSYGNPVDDVEPSVEAGQATLGEPARVGPGRWMLPYRPRRIGADTDDVVVARAGGVSGQRTIQLAVAMNRFSLGPKAGVGFQSGGMGLATGVEVAAWARLGKQQAGLVLEGWWWRVASRGALQDLGGTGYRDERTYLPLVLSAAWRKPLRSQMMLWLGGGGGAARVTAVNRVSGQAGVSSEGWAPAASGAISLGLWAWNGFPFVEVRATWIGDPKLPTLRGPVAALLLQLGYRFHAS